MKNNRFQCFGLSAVQALVLIPRKLGKYAILLIGATFVWSNWSKISPVETIPTKINTQHLWNHCGSSHSFCMSIIITYTKDCGEIIRHTKEIIGYTKDCGEKFQKVQKLIKSFLINSYFQHKLTEKDPLITTEI